MGGLSEDRPKRKKKSGEKRQTTGSDGKITKVAVQWRDESLTSAIQNGNETKRNN